MIFNYFYEHAIPDGIFEGELLMSESRTRDRMCSNLNDMNGKNNGNNFVEKLLLVICSVNLIPRRGHIQQAYMTVTVSRRIESSRNTGGQEDMLAIIFKFN